MSAGCATRRSGVLAMLRSRPSSPRNAETRGVHTTPGRDRVDPDARRPQLDRAGAHQRHEPGLGRAVRRVARRRRDARHRRDEHHRAAVLAASRARRTAWRGTRGAARCRSASPSPRRVMLGEVGVARHADDVDDAVDPAERAAGVVEQALHVGAVERVAARAAMPSDLGGDVGGEVGVLVDAREPRARPTRARATPDGRCPDRHRARRSDGRRGAAARDSRGRGCRRCGSSCADPGVDGRLLPGAARLRHGDLVHDVEVHDCAPHGSGDGRRRYLASPSRSGERSTTGIDPVSYGLGRRRSGRSRYAA